MLTRNITAYPYAGHTFICNDIIGVADVKEAYDSALHVIEFGKPSQTGQMRLQNEGGILREHPVLGLTDGMIFYPALNYTKAAVSFHPSLNRYTIVATVRLQGGSEFSANGQTGPGGRASYWEVGFGGYNAAGVVNYDLVNRFFMDPIYYRAGYWGALPPVSIYDRDWGSMLGEGEKFKTVVITGSLNAFGFLVANNESVGYIQFGLNYPTNPLTNPWTALQMANGVPVSIAPAPHPITGIDLYCDGIVDFQVYFHK